MRVTVIGCSGSVPGPASPASCYLVEADDDGGRTWRVVLDLGNGALGPLQRHLDPTTLDAVLLSHLHHDHAELGSLRLLGDVPVLTRDGSRPHRLSVSAYDDSMRLVGTRDVHLTGAPVRLEEFAGRVVVPVAVHAETNGTFVNGERITSYSE